MKALWSVIKVFLLTGLLGIICSCVDDFVHVGKGVYPVEIISQEHQGIELSLSKGTKTLGSFGTDYDWRNMPVFQALGKERFYFFIQVGPVKLQLNL